MKTSVRLTTGLLFTILAAVFLAPVIQVNTLPLLGVALVASIIPMPKCVARDGIVLEHWANYIVERLWKDNGFLRFAYDDSRYADGSGRIIHIPQPGSKPAVQKNRSVFPAAAVRRADTDVLYALDEYTTDPTHIPNIDAIDISYDMQDSVLGDHMQVLNELVANDMLIKWATNGTVYKTTGGAGAATVGPIDGQVGNRLGLHHSDFKKLMIKANVDNVDKNNRYALVDDNMYEFFYDSLSETMQRDFSRMVDAANGVVGKIHSWNILTRSSVIAANNADAIKALDAAIGATDSLGCIAWQKNSVAFAIGAKKLFQDKDNPIYYGDIHSALVMAGGRVRRGDSKGIYTIIQGTPQA